MNKTLKKILFASSLLALSTTPLIALSAETNSNNEQQATVVTTSEQATQLTPSMVKSYFETNKTFDMTKTASENITKANYDITENNLTFTIQIVGEANANYGLNSDQTNKTGSKLIFYQVVNKNKTNSDGSYEELTKIQSVQVDGFKAKELSTLNDYYDYAYNSLLWSSSYASFMLPINETLYDNLYKSLTNSVNIGFSIIDQIKPSIDQYGTAPATAEGADLVTAPLSNIANGLYAKYQEFNNAKELLDKYDSMSLSLNSTYTKHPSDTVYNVLIQDIAGTKLQGTNEQILNDLNNSFINPDSDKLYVVWKNVSISDDNTLHLTYAFALKSSDSNDQNTDINSLPMTTNKVIDIVEKPSTLKLQNDDLVLNNKLAWDTAKQIAEKAKSEVEDLSKDQSQTSASSNETNNENQTSTSTAKNEDGDKTKTTTDTKLESKSKAKNNEKGGIIAAGVIGGLTLLALLIAFGVKIFKKK